MTKKFRFPVDARAMTAVALRGSGADAGHAQLIGLVGRFFADRDRALEDYLNTVVGAVATSGFPVHFNDGINDYNIAAAVGLTDMVLKVVDVPTGTRTAQLALEVRTAPSAIFSQWSLHDTANGNIVSITLSSGAAAGSQAINLDNVLSFLHISDSSHTMELSMSTITDIYNIKVAGAAITTKVARAGNANLVGIIDIVSGGQIDLLAGAGTDALADINASASEDLNATVGRDINLFATGKNGGAGRKVNIRATTSINIGAAAAQLIGLYNATAVAQPAAIGAPAGGATIDVQARAAIVSILNALGAAAGGIGITA